MNAKTKNKIFLSLGLGMMLLTGCTSIQQQNTKLVTKSPDGLSKQYAIFNASTAASFPTSMESVDQLNGNEVFLNYVEREGNNYLLVELAHTPLVNSMEDMSSHHNITSSVPEIRGITVKGYNSSITLPVTKSDYSRDLDSTVRSALIPLNSKDAETVKNLAVGPGNVVIHAQLANGLKEDLIFTSNFRSGIKEYIPTI